MHTWMQQQPCQQRPRTAAARRLDRRIVQLDRKLAKHANAQHRATA
jgi:hypothetical protein